MLYYTDSTVFNTSAQTLVNTVNCVGVMGAGLALDFKLRFPAMYKDYCRRCRRREIEVGKLSLYQTNKLPYIINFPTKKHWKYPAKLDWIEAGLQYFVEYYQDWGITSVAFPKLGCDRGGLNWEVVKVMMAQYLDNLTNLEVYICEDTQTNAQGIEGYMVALVNQIDSWGKALGLSPGLITQVTQILPIYRFRDLLACSQVTKEIYQELFFLVYPIAEHQYQCQGKPELILKDFSPLETDLFRIDNQRLFCLLILSDYIQLTPQQISKITWHNFLELGPYKLITIPHEESILLSDNLWQQLQITRINLATNSPIIASLGLGQKGKPLSPRTIQKLIRQAQHNLTKFS